VAKKESKVENEVEEKPRETTVEFLSSLSAVLVTGLFIITFVVQAFEIPSSSMENTLLIGDHVFVNRIQFAPKTSWMGPMLPYRQIRRGDIVVFLAPCEPGLYVVKRIMGVPGDHIHLRHGVVYLNGVAQIEPHAIQPSDDANPDNPQAGYQPYRDDFPSVTPSPDEQVTEIWREELPRHIQGDDLVVPPGAVFAMGDNRTESLDGRYWGFVPQQNILGRPLFVYWSFETPADQENKTSIGDRIGFMFHIVTHVFTETRWKRTFHVIR